MNKKAASGTMLTLLLIGTLTLAFNTVPTTASLAVHNIDTGLDYATIQEAIDASKTLDGHTILVDAGIYYEHVVLDKTVSLIGENSHTTIIDGNGAGKVIMVIADNVNISGFTIRNGYYGIHLKQSNSSVLRDNNMTGNTVNFIVSGILLLRFIHDIDTSNTVDGKPVYYWVNQHHRKVPSGAGYVAIINSTNITVESLNVSKTQGVLFVHTNYSIIENVNVSSNYIGIHLIGSSNNTITGNIVANNMQFGIYLDGLFFPLGLGGEWLWSTGNNLIDNMVLKNTKSGICLNGRAGSYVYGGNIISGNTITSNDRDGFYSISDSDIIVGNTITNNGGGITLDFSDRSTIIGNTVLNNGAGIYLSRSSGNTLRDNNVTDNEYNFGVFGDSISDFIQEIDASNIVNGKPIYYLVNQRNMAVDPLTFPDAGYLGLVNSTHITVRDLHLASKNYQGVLFAYTNESIIEGVTSSYNKAGIWLRASTKNFVKCITSSYNQYGIQLHTSNNNVIEGVTSLYDEVGIQLRSSIDNAIKNSIVENSMLGLDLMMWSDGNIISANTIKNNICGIQVIHSGNATIYHNNLIDNTFGLVFPSRSSGNICDDGYPSGGNYWSDYTGVDVKSGPYQNETGSDGLGDTPYAIDADNQDNYPLMEPWSPPPDVNGDGIVDILDIVVAGKAFASYPGHPRWDSRADMNNDDVVDIFDLLLIAINLGKTA